MSHAVGCAFAVCLERKQQREKDCEVKAEFGVGGTTFTRIGSFRQATLTEKLLDPQISQVVEPPAVHKNEFTRDDIHARARPRASEDLMYRRYSSMRLPASASAYNYSAINTPSSAAATPQWAATFSNDGNTSANSTILLPPPPSSGSSFRRSASLRLDSSTAANVVAASNRPFVPFQQPVNQVHMSSSLSTSSQLGAATGVLNFPRSSSAQAGFSTPQQHSHYAPPPVIPEEDPWTAPVANAADAVTQLCEQLTAGLLQSPPNQQQVQPAVQQPAYSTVPSHPPQQLTPLHVSTTSSGHSPVNSNASPFNNSNSATRNPFLSTTSSQQASAPHTPLQQPQQQQQQQQQQQHMSSPYATAPGAVPSFNLNSNNYFPAPQQWTATFQQEQNQVTNGFSPELSSPAWPSAIGEVQQVTLNSSTNSNPFKDAPFVAKI